jgi:hypothetical protein
MLQGYAREDDQLTPLPKQHKVQSKHDVARTHVQDGHVSSESSSIAAQAGVIFCENDAIIAALLAEGSHVSLADRSSELISISPAKQRESVAPSMTLRSSGQGSHLSSCENDAVLAALLATGCSAGNHTERTNFHENDAVLATLLDERHAPTSPVNGHGMSQVGAPSSSCENDAALAAMLNEEFLVDTDNALAEMRLQSHEQKQSRHVQRQPSQLMQVLQPSSALQPPTSSTVGQETAQNECSICMDSFASACLVPCGHTDFCMQCARQLQDCAICRTPVEEVVGTVKPVRPVKV